MEKNIKIEYLTNLELLTQVVNLGKQNSKTLGFLPQGAFEEYFKKKSIIVAIKENRLIGYLLFRTTNKHLGNPHIVIVHLCIDKDHRGKDIPKLLYDLLERDAINKGFFAVKLKCKRDYTNATKLWNKLGFTQVYEKKGKSNDLLVLWQKELKPLPLLNLTESIKNETKVKVVIDTNVFIRLQEDINQSLTSDDLLLFEEAKALTDDWLEEEIEILITSEVKMEISKNKDQDIRKKRLYYAGFFKEIKADEDKIEYLHERLSKYFPKNPNENTMSDIRHLCIAILNNIEFYLTQDEPLLKRATEIEDFYNIKVIKPAEFIVSLDELKRDSEYRPIEIAGSELEQLKLSGNFDEIAMKFLCSACKEKFKTFSKYIHAIISDVEKCDVFIQKQDEKLLGLLCLEKRDNELLVPMLRIEKGKLSGTLQRYLLHWIVRYSIKQNKLITKVVDRCNHTQMVASSYEIGFTKDEDSLIKINLQGLKTSKEIIEELKIIKNKFPFLNNFINTLILEIKDAILKNDPYKIKFVENKISPAKIIDSGIPIYVIPIKPQWAQHLFDEKLAQQTFFKAEIESALSFENAYYRSAKVNKYMKYPARIVWYITSGQHIGTKQIRAISTLDNIDIDKPKNLFNKYKRLGIYKWNDIYKAANMNIDNELMVILFSNTIILKNPIDLQEYRRIFIQSEKKDPCLRSPQEISATTFQKIYNYSEDN